MATTNFKTYFSKTQNANAQILTGISLGGVEGLQETLQALGDRALFAAARSLNQVSEEIMTEAKTLTPVDTGNLRASGHVQPPEVIDQWVVSILGFGGPAGKGTGNVKDVGYALPVHERMDVHHPIGQAKYLEQPMLEAAAHLEQRLGDLLRAELSGGFA